MSNYLPKPTKGRKRIIIEKEINAGSIIEVLEEALQVHNENIRDIDYLLRYFKGEQNIYKRTQLEAGYNREINNKTVINYAWSSVRDIVGYTFGKSTQYTPTVDRYRKEIEEISRILAYENNSLADHESSTYASICGVGYLCTLPSKELLSDYMPDIPLIDVSLDPKTTFVVQSARIGNPVILSVTYYTDKEKTYFMCYTDKEIYYIVAKGNLSLVDSTGVQVYTMANPVGLNPITQVENNGFLMGDFEVAISVLDAINQLASDTLNDVENVIKSLLVVINAELNGEVIKKVQDNKILNLVAGDVEKRPDAKFIYQQLDAMGMQNMREYLEEAYKQIIGIPDRKTRGGGGGDTGDAVKLRDGWADIEIVARIKEQYFKKAKRKQLAVAIKIMQELDLIGKEISTKYIDIKIPRNQVDNLQTKAQAFSTINGTKTLHPADALDIVEMTTDVEGKVERGIKYWEEYQEKQLEIQSKYTEENKEGEAASSSNKAGQQQENQYNTNIKETKERKEIIKKEQGNKKRERIY